jgi:hypothetical protein
MLQVSMGKVNVFKMNSPEEIFPKKLNTIAFPFAKCVYLLF